MPPRRPLPDLDLISVFKMLTPKEQLVASKMSPRCAILVRAANRTVKTLVITAVNYEFHDLKNHINSFSLASKPSMQQLVDISGETFPDYPMTTHLSKWNWLMIYPNCFGWIDTEPIVTVFSAVTDLKFIVNDSKHNEALVFLLQHPNWQRQLTNLVVNRTYWMKSQLAVKLILAINGLTALQHLALDWRIYTKVPDLSILAQLKTVVFKSDRLSAFLRSLELNATNNAHLEVHLISNDTKALLTLSQPLHSRIVRYGWNLLDYTHDQVPLLISQFRSLTSLEIKGIEPTEVGQLFSDLSQLHQLIHLKFGIIFRKGEDELPPLPERPLVQLNSVRALELYLHITSHSQIEWLNLPWTMPNLKTINIDNFRCNSCGTLISCCTSHSSLLSSSPALACFRASLFNLHPGVPLNQIILLSHIYPFSAEKLLLQSQ